MGRGRADCLDYKANHSLYPPGRGLDFKSSIGDFHKFFLQKVFRNLLLESLAMGVGKLRDLFFPIGLP